jgi:hypothetical protein
MGAGPSSAGTVGDQRFDGLFEGQPPEVRGAIFKQLTSRLEFDDRMSAYLAFIDWTGTGIVPELSGFGRPLYPINV